MKKLVNRIVVAVVVCLMVSTLAWANVINKQVTFSNDVKVNGTLVKKGTYKLKFDDQTGELTLINGKTNVKVMAHWEQREGKARQDSVNSIKESDGWTLQSMSFEGENRSLVVGKGQGDASASHK